MDDRGRVAALRLLLRGDRARRADLLALRDAQLRRVVAHAHAEVPLYRRLFAEAGADPAAVRGAGDLPALPLTSRQSMQGERLEDRLARTVDSRRLSTKWTSGTAGAPLAIGRTRLEDRVRGACRLMALRAFGVRATDRRVGVTVPPRTHRPPSVGALAGAVRAAGLHRQTNRYVTRDLDAIAREVRRLRPEVVHAYAGLLAMLADRMPAAAPGEPRPRLAISGAEVLTPLM